MASFIAQSTAQGKAEACEPIQSRRDCDDPGTVLPSVEYVRRGRRRQQLKRRKKLRLISYAEGGFDDEALSVNFWLKQFMAAVVKIISLVTNASLLLVQAAHPTADAIKAVIYIFVSLSRLIILTLINTIEITVEKPGNHGLSEETIQSGWKPTLARKFDKNVSHTCEVAKDDSQEVFPELMIEYAGNYDAFLSSEETMYTTSAQRSGIFDNLSGREEKMETSEDKQIMWAAGGKISSDDTDMQCLTRGPSVTAMSYGDRPCLQVGDSENRPFAVSNLAALPVNHNLMKSTGAELGSLLEVEMECFVDADLNANQNRSSLKKVLAPCDEAVKMDIDIDDTSNVIMSCSVSEGQDHTKSEWEKLSARARDLQVSRYHNKHKNNEESVPLLPTPDSHLMLSRVNSAAPAKSQFKIKANNISSVPMKQLTLDACVPKHRGANVLNDGHGQEYIVNNVAADGNCLFIVYYQL
jgi:hypothetical protein